MVIERGRLSIVKSSAWPATLGGPRHSATGPLGVLYSANNRSGSRSNTVGGRFCAPDVAKAAPSASGDKTEVRCIDGLAGETRRYWTLTRWQRLLHRSEEHTSELQSLMRISYAVFCLKKKKR